VGVVVDGERDADGQWILDGAFSVFTTDQELMRVLGWGVPCRSLVMWTSSLPHAADFTKTGFRRVGDGQGNVPALNF
jgi:hypothetical protein